MKTIARPQYVRGGGGGGGGGKCDGGWGLGAGGGGGGFWRKMGGGRGKIYGKKSEFGAGVPEKKIRKKKGRG